MKSEKLSCFLLPLLLVIAVLYLIFAHSDDHRLNCDELESIFIRNKKVFENVTSVFFQLQIDSLEYIGITKKDPNNEKIETNHIKDLYFSNNAGVVLSESTLLEVYSVVDVLFQEEDVQSVYYSVANQRINISLYNNYGYDSSIFYSLTEVKHGGYPDICEIRELGNNWFAVVSCD